MPRVKRVKRDGERGCICFVNTKRRTVALDTSKLPKRLLGHAMTWQRRKSEVVLAEDWLGEAVVAHAEALAGVSSWLTVDERFMQSALSVAKLNAEVQGKREALRWLEGELPKGALDRILAAVVA